MRSAKENVYVKRLLSKPMFRYPRILLLILLLFPLLALAGKRKYPYPVDRHGHPIYLSQDTWVSDNRILVQRPDSLYGYLDGEQREVIPCIYQFAEPFCNGKALVMLNGKYGVVDTNGKEVVPCMFKSISGHVVVSWQRSSCLGDIVSVSTDGASGIYDVKEHKFYPAWHGDGYTENYDIAWCKKVYTVHDKHLLCGLIDEHGAVVLQPIYSFIGRYTNTGIRVSLDGKWGFVSLAGREIIPVQYDSAKDFANGFAAVKLKGKWGFVNERGQLIVSCKYDGVSGYSKNGIAAVCLNNLWGAIDTVDRIRVSIVNQDVKIFKSGYALQRNGKIALANSQGVI